MAVDFWGVPRSYPETAGTPALTPAGTLRDKTWEDREMTLSRGESVERCILEEKLVREDFEDE